MSTTASKLCDKVFLVTGSTDGIGRHTATKLAQAGAQVFVHGRDEKRVEAAVKSVAESAESADKVKGFCADISTLSGMRSLCEQVQQSTDHLEGLVSNAGIFYSKRELTEDGVEKVFATNVLAPYVITGLLLPLLRKGSATRVITVSSISQGYATGLKDLQFEKGGFSDHSSYSLSKLCDAMLSMELHERFGGENLAFNTLDPGTVNTKMLDAGWGMCGISVSRADNQFHLATAPELEGVSGEYFVSKRKTRAHSACYDQAARKQLWDYLEKLSGVSY